MKIKHEMSKKEIIDHSVEIFDMINQNRNFFFYFSPDPDAIGVSVAFSLFLKGRNKKSIIYLPEGIDPNIEFLFEIASYNGIEILKTIAEVKAHLSKEEHVFVLCDTATHFILPQFDKIKRLKEQLCHQNSIEIDHHFGGDSEQIFPRSISIFYRANTSCEILCNFFQFVHQHEKSKKNLLDFFPRNIVLSLLVGVCFDTQFGKFIVDVSEYEKWFYFLSERLEYMTWKNSNYIRTADEVFNNINKMSEVKIKTLKKIVNKGNYLGGIGLVIIPPISIYDSLAENNDSTCILSKIVGDLANMIPEKAGSIGILTFYDATKQLFFLKIRRAFKFKAYDLRDLASLLGKIFAENFLGGGGHAGATSFRINHMPRPQFIEKVKELQQELAQLLRSFK